MWIPLGRGGPRGTGARERPPLAAAAAAPAAPARTVATPARGLPRLVPMPVPAPRGGATPPLPTPAASPTTGLRRCLSPRASPVVRSFSPAYADTLGSLRTPPSDPSAASAAIRRTAARRGTSAVTGYAMTNWLMSRAASALLSPCMPRAEGNRAPLGALRTAGALPRSAVLPPSAPVGEAAVPNGMASLAAPTARWPAVLLRLK